RGGTGEDGSGQTAWDCGRWVSRMVFEGGLPYRGLVCAAAGLPVGVVESPDADGLPRLGAKGNRPAGVAAARCGERAPASPPEAAPSRAWGPRPVWRPFGESPDGPSGQMPDGRIGTLPG